MKKIFLCLLLLVGVVGIAKSDEIKTPQETNIKFGYCRYDSILKTLPEYAEGVRAYDTLVAKYKKELAYNEQNFRKLFSDYLAGQKDFPLNIMLKRQKDLQIEMERNLAFQSKSDSLLARAKPEFFLPARERLNQILSEIGKERNYMFILDLDSGGFPFVNITYGEDATPYILEKLLSNKTLKP